MSEKVEELVGREVVADGTRPRDSLFGFGAFFGGVEGEGEGEEEREEEEEESLLE